MAVAAKPMLDENLLIHYGVRGMKWGLRKSKGTTGISRRRGAVIDRNDRDLDVLNTYKKALNTGKGPRMARVVNRINRMTMGKKLTEKYYDRKISQMESQNARIKTGQLRFNDRVRTTAIMTMPLDMILTVRPK